MSKIYRGSLAVAVLGALTAPSFAQAPVAPSNPAPAARTARASVNDPVICEKQEVVGSRLAVKRICKTRSQWADSRLQDRQEIDRGQRSIGVKEGH
jgi:hypothetical protein